jgi:biotin transporter BioY
MDESRSRSFAGLLACAIIVGLLALYVAGFFVLGTVGSWNLGPRTLRLRVYSHPWEAALFRPLAKVEGLLIRQETETAYRN